MQHNPNHIPRHDRIFYIILSGALFIYGTFGVIVDDLFVPGKRSLGTHYHGGPAWLLYGAFLCAVANMVSVVVDHYDQRDNEINYKRFARITQIAGWAFFILALTLDSFVLHQGTK